MKKQKKQESLSGRVRGADIRLLRVFKTVVECGGFSAAEVELNIGRSAISRYMADLEIRLNMRLCNRGRSGFSLTDHGRVVYESTLQVLSDLERFRAKINAAHSYLAGTFCLGLADDMVTDNHTNISTAVARFRERGPAVEILLEIDSPNKIERAVIEGRVQIGVIPYHHQLPTLQYYPLYDEPLFFYCGVGHDLFNIPTAQISPANIGRHDFVAPRYAHSAELKKFFPRMKPAARSNQMEGIATLILSGKYIGFLPGHFANQWVRLKQMRTLLPKQLHFSIPFVAITQKSAELELLRDAFLEELLRIHPAKQQETTGVV